MFADDPERFPEPVTDGLPCAFGQRQFLDIHRLQEHHVIDAVDQLLLFHSDLFDLGDFFVCDFNVSHNSEGEQGAEDQPATAPCSVFSGCLMVDVSIDARSRRRCLRWVVRWIVVSELGSAAPVPFSIGFVRVFGTVEPHTGVARVLHVDSRPQAPVEAAIPFVVSKKTCKPSPANKAAHPTAFGVFLHCVDLLSPWMASALAVRSFRRSLTACSRHTTSQQ